MAVIVTLEGGSQIHASTLGMSGALARIAEGVAETDARLARWLADVSERTAPFLNFDLRGLSLQHRDAFWQGVSSAHERTATWDQEASYSGAVEVIRRFHDSRETHNDRVSEWVKPISLDHLWFADEPEGKSPWR